MHSEADEKILASPASLSRPRSQFGLRELARCPGPLPENRSRTCLRISHAALHSRTAGTYVAQVSPASICGGSRRARELDAHAPGTRQAPARVTDSSSPRRKWATARREESAVAWRLWASGSWSECLAPSSPCHGKKGHHPGAAAPGVHDSVALAARLRDGLRVKIGDGPLGCEVARDSAASGGQ